MGMRVLCVCVFAVHVCVLLPVILSSQILQPGQLRVHQSQESTLSGVENCYTLLVNRSNLSIFSVNVP